MARTKSARRPAKGQQEGATDLPGVAVRRVAVEALRRVVVAGRRLDPAEDPQFQALSPRDRGLAHALVSAALRHLPGIDQLLDATMQQPLSADSATRHVLRIALAGHFCLETPGHAVVATSLALAKGGQRRLVHGVLGRLLRSEAQLPPAVLPGQFYAHWAQMWGKEVAEAAVGLFVSLPPTDLCLKQPAETEHWAEVLGGVSYWPGHVRLSGSQHVEDLPGFAEGAWWVQDLAAQLPVALLGAVAGKRVLDLCAAPGGKTMQLVAAGARVTALDSSKKRMARLARNLMRTGLAAELVVADALNHSFAAPFDAILLDAPCSAVGTFRRHPDVLYLKDGKKLEKPLALQQQLLARAATWLRPGGRLVYAVCSLDKREGGVTPSGVQPDGIEKGELPAWVALEGHCAATPPTLSLPAGGADGFQIARFRAP